MNTDQQNMLAFVLLKKNIVKLKDMTDWWKTGTMLIFNNNWKNKTKAKNEPQSKTNNKYRKIVTDSYSLTD